MTHRNAWFVAACISIALCWGAQEALATTYYVSSSRGSDANSGLSTSAPWRTLAKVQGAALKPGDVVAFRRGDSWSGGLTISQSGSSAGLLTFGWYGSTSDPRPTIKGGSNGYYFLVNGSYVQIDNLTGSACGYAGAALYGSHDTVKYSLFTGNAAGIQTAPGSSFDHIYSNTLRDNNILNQNTPSTSSGAFGILLNGSDGEIDHNTISGSRTTSLAYGWDGSGVEIYNGSRNVVHHNKMIDNDAVMELGGASDSNRIEYNRGSSSTADTQATGFVLPGSATNTRIDHNSIYLVGSQTKALVCYSGCASTTSFIDNVLRAEAWALWTDGSGPIGGNVVNGRTNPAPLPPGNSTAPARLVNPPSDLHLTSSSPAIDFATTISWPVDLDGKSVPYGPRPDSGTYEYRPAA